MAHKFWVSSLACCTLSWRLNLGVIAWFIIDIDFPSLWWSLMLLSTIQSVNDFQVVINILQCFPASLQELDSFLIMMWFTISHYFWKLKFYCTRVAVFVCVNDCTQVSSLLESFWRNRWTAATVLEITHFIVCCRPLHLVYITDLHNGDV